ncbi:DUF2726 domain-containing protein [Acinetobacter sp. 194]|uniref:DUF2726 domain-containing protein n=1 Tax=Acinetobacter shaoyimingii TaxID=2715164 RepID=UPI00140CE31F|nr:DUF2726 domain-containing protein [Acinetobacter shaoyimingii]NHB57920.1 DUF2726 domain-containing protein [Acinetobacter shaoyimingii]
MVHASQFTFFIIGCAFSIALFITIISEKVKSKSTAETTTNKREYYSKPVITRFETKMFQRLKQAFPDHHILAQVAFSSLITSDYMPTRNKFNRKVTDFVILNHHLDVICIIELDDPSHTGKEDEDAKRDAMLNEAGYRVVRYDHIPTVKHLQKEVIGK